jgi:hypothetical protein
MADDDPIDSIPDLGLYEGTFRDVSPLLRFTPYTPNWWSSQTIDRVPETAVGWLVAQGWQVVRTYAEEDCGQTFYVMNRQSMQNWMILQTLLEEYVSAFNEGRKNNSIRYNDIIDLWIDMVKKNRQHLDRQADLTNTRVDFYFTTLDSLVTDIEDEIGDIRESLDGAEEEIEEALQDHANTLVMLESDYNTHAPIARAFLTDLGVTELARINEQFDNLLSKSTQDITNRGLYSSALITQVTARVERERSEAITSLNDRLNREKLANQHQLYGQQFSMRGAVTQGAAQRTQIQMAKGEWLVRSHQSLLATKLQVRMAQAQSRLEGQQRENALMAYQLDHRTNLGLGLFGFVERREDAYPSLESITKLVAGLGDSGGGWVAP